MLFFCLKHVFYVFLTKNKRKQVWKICRKKSLDEEITFSLSWQKTLLISWNKSYMWKRGVFLLPTHDFLLFIFLSKKKENHLNDKEKKVDKEKFFFFDNSCPKNPPNRRQQWFAIFEFLLFSFLQKKREENLNDKKKKCCSM